MDQIEEQERRAEAIRETLVEREALMGAVTASMDARLPAGAAGKIQRLKDARITIRQGRLGTERTIKERTDSWERKVANAEDFLEEMASNSPATALHAAKVKGHSMHQTMYNQAALLVATRYDLFEHVPGFAKQILSLAAEEAIQAPLQQVISMGKIEMKLRDDRIKHLEGLLKDYDADKNEIDVLKRDLKAARTEVDTTKGELETTKGELETTKGELERTRGELQTATTKLDTIQAAFVTIRDDLGAIRTQFRGVQDQFGITRGELEAARTEVRTTKGELETTKGVLATTKGELQAAIAKLDTVQTGLQTVGLELGTIREQFGNIQDQFGTTRTELETAQADIRAARGDLETARQQNGSLIQSISSMTVQQQQKTTQFDTDIAAKDEKVRSLEQTKTRLEGLNESQAQSITALEAKATNNEKAHNDTLAKNKTEFDAKVTALEAKTTEFDEKVREVTDLQAKIKNLERDVQTQKDAYSRLKASESVLTKREQSLVEFHASEFNSIAAADSASWKPFVNALLDHEQTDGQPLSSEEPWAILPPWVGDRPTGKKAQPGSIMVLCGQLFSGVLNFEFNACHIHEICSSLARSLAKEVFVPVDLVIFVLQRVLDNSEEKDLGQSDTFDHFYLVPVWQVAKILQERWPNHVGTMPLVDHARRLVAESGFAPFHDLIQNGCNHIATELESMQAPDEERLFCPSLGLGFIGFDPRMINGLLIVCPQKRSLWFVARSRLQLDYVFRIKAPEGESDIVLDIMDDRTGWWAICNK